MTIGMFKKARVQDIDIFLPSQNKRVVDSLSLQEDGKMRGPGNEVGNICGRGSL